MPSRNTFPNLSGSGVRLRHFAFLLLLVAVAAGGLVGGAAGEKKSEAPPLPKIHPLIFSMVQGWLSDGESPIVSEINLDAVALSHNQFDPEAVKQEDEWTRCPSSDGKGFLRYRMLESSKAQHYKVEYQENGGGSLTTSAHIEYAIERREIRKDGKLVSIRVLRVLAYHSK